MHRQVRNTDAVHFFMSELSSRVVAKSQQPSDRYHLGKLVLQSLKDAPDLVLQIDGGRDEMETSGSVAERSVRCALALQRLGLGVGDVMVLMAPNHLDLCIPYYAALYLGIIIAPIDRTLTVKELQDVFEVDKPKIIFCQSERTDDVQSALNALNQNPQVVAFDKGHGNALSFNELLKKYGNESDVKDFEPTDFNSKVTTAFIVSTSGTTGVPKQATLTHENIAIAGPYLWCLFKKFPNPIRRALIVSPLQWMTAIFIYNDSAILRFTRIQSSSEMTQEHTYHCINKYKPSYMIVSPSFLRTMVRKGDRNQCDFSSYEFILVGGSAVSKDLIAEVEETMPNVTLVNGYGMTEVAGVGLTLNHWISESSGTPSGHLQYRLIDVKTQEDIVEPHKPGELWVKGDCISKGYFNNPQANKNAFTEDGWLKSGDVFYRDENWNFYFVERIKFLLKYKNHQVSPVELENVIRRHPGVIEVAVTGIPDPECGELPVACVVKKAGCHVTAQEIKDLVKENLTDSKHLRGGVIFMEKLPMTASSKLHITLLKEMVNKLPRE